MAAQVRTVSLFDVDDVDTFCRVSDMRVSPVPAGDVNEFCRRWHYTNGGGSTLWNYGLWDGDTLVGVVSYNLPTMPACSAFFGKEHWEWVVHMGRLVCADDAPRNSESRLIAGSLRLLKRDRPVARACVTYAAVSVGHIGYVYQATNALYLGTTQPDRYLIDDKGRRRSPRSRPEGSGTNEADQYRNMGWTVHREPGKHRYLYLLGNKTERKEALELLRFDVLPYPKAEKAGAVA
jgi:hypothetical protein